jgi:hypothetical protein
MLVAEPVRIGTVTAGTMPRGGRQARFLTAEGIK